MRKATSFLVDKSLGAAKVYAKYTYQSVLLAAKVLYGLLLILGLLGALGAAVDSWNGGTGDEPVAMGPPSPPPAGPPAWYSRDAYTPSGDDHDDAETMEAVLPGHVMTVDEMSETLSDGFGVVVESVLDQTAALFGFGLRPVVDSVREGLEVEASRQAVRRWRARAAVREIAEIEASGPLGRLRRHENAVGRAYRPLGSNMHIIGF